MARYMLIESGVAANAVEVTDPEQFPQWELVRSDEAAIGDLWDGHGFTRPPAPTPEVPDEVDMAQARLALLDAGLLDLVPGAIAQFPSPDKEKALIQWEFRATVRRNSPLTIALGEMLGLTSADIDRLFIQAKQL